MLPNLLGEKKRNKFTVTGGLSTKPIAIYRSSINYLDFDCNKCVRIKFNGNAIPVAQRITKIRLITIPRLAFYVITLLALIGIVLCIVCFYYNVRYRHVKHVKLSSPRLNNMVLFGCTLIYFAVILFGIDGLSSTTFARICMVSKLF